MRRASSGAHARPAPAAAVLLFVGLHVAAAVAHAAPRITPGPSMRLAGTHTFAFDPDGVVGTVSWWLDRETVNDTGLHVRTDSIATGTGLTVTFALPKVSGSETIYHVNAALGAWRDTKSLHVFPPNLRSWYTHHSIGNPDVRVWSMFPASLSPSSRVVLALHGNSRNAASVADHWRNWAIAHDYIVLCPLFDVAEWPTIGDYQFGNVFSDVDCFGSLNPAAQWGFTIDESIHREVRDGVELLNGWYDLWGFSAGGQHVHRLMAFRPQANVRVAISAGSGWYTVPDLNIDCPYGLRNPQLSFSASDIQEWTLKDMVLMVGTADTVRDSEVRITPEADAQGLNRVERAAYMHAKGLAANPLSRWRRVEVAGVGHDAKAMAQAAQGVLQGTVLDSAAPPPRITTLATFDVRPNPVVAGSELHGAHWPGEGDVRVEVLDLAGRRVASGVARAGEGEWRVGWRELAGAERLAPGLYLVRARGRGSQCEKKVLVVP